MKRLLTLLPALLLLLLALRAGAHELRPAYLQIEQRTGQEFAVSWRVPARGDLRLSLNVRFDQGVTPLGPPVGRIANGYYTETWSILHESDLAGVSVTIDGLQNTMTDALAHIRWRDGREQLQRLLPDRPQFVVDRKASSGQIATTYLVLGIEHILLGLDHLLFVLALVLLVRSWKPLVATITAFTLAHSITLAAAVLGFVSVPQAPVEAVIALSIVFVASEILQRRRGRDSLAIRKPWLVAFGFGLLHGLGFAGALTEIGVPQHAIPLALALFNIGVEAGQLAFIAAVAAVFVLLQRLPPVQQWQLRTGQSVVTVASWPLAYLVGGLAAWWLLDRTLSMLI
ncbi:Hydrogenase/urease accessory protein HupE [Microbulbifer donghaiensis]|uniref:Hydrogenase/urease accessory protein HupE n=1 Tax=Microbulbifer donghaiensis TaxID=494016 RepID=A0A1M5CY37_9GAMM|nr:HupE/UreJ family protein [Microbulbifer donghaiensis]SHF59591.1 Hydrogenase/urease accessory protein HupE [Microbulbifer donghaiensis]